MQLSDQGASPQRTPRQLEQPLDEHRDMSGDAKTEETKEAGGKAQCTLSAVRNLRRNETYSIERLSEHCIGRENHLDILNPDWPHLMQPILKENERVHVGTWRQIPQSRTHEIRVAVSVSWSPAHVIVLFNNGDGSFRVYDNESEERTQGTYGVSWPHTLAERPNDTAYVIVNADSPLGADLGPAVTTARRAPLPPERRERRQRRHAARGAPQ